MISTQDDIEVFIDRVVYHLGVYRIDKIDRPITPDTEHRGRSSGKSIR